ncbi:hypothetical protein L4174_018890 [Photobacterium sp. CCB-ST2H9]|uniref:hypothetical protein n=1 Tax=Photobacterium sp. CCB-ST2H9 TaxID=2912855 RepID=UPI00200636AF|nr:hypothetical protein [Photobacterium sp. CCB-ST2H9]UTM60127.1 hypothetical protein L4174_018890 [Photobacterium sp. CCB-ST2H9]
MAKSKWKDPLAAKELIQRLSELKFNVGDSHGLVRMQQNFNSAFNNTNFDLYELLLKEQYRFSEDIPEFKRDIFVSEAIFQAADKDMLNAGYVAEQIRKQQEKYLLQPVQSYTLITKISLAGIKSKVKVKTPRSSIVISKYFPNIFKNHYDFDFINKSCVDLNELNYSWVTVTVSSRCENSAVSKSLSELSFYLGVINLFYNYGHDRKSYGMRFEPVNKLRRFKYHMIHFSSGEQASNLCWYESNFADYAKSLHYERDNFQDANRKYRKLLKSIESINRYSYFRTVFNRYVEALESTDMNKSFRSLWSLLETLTFTQKDNYNVTIHRTVALFKDRFLMKQKLELLRERRNMAIHSQTDFSDAEQITYMLMRIINAYIFAIINVMKVASSENQIKAVLDLPYDTQKLNDLESTTQSSLENITIFKKLIGD